MRPSDDRERAAVFDFIDEYLSDLDSGGAQPLAHYLARFKGFEEAVAREYLTLRGEERAEQASASTGVEADERRIGPYRLLRELGRGGQGSVWLAEDVRIARKVALKVLASRFESVSEDRRRRFRREAEVIARLEHPSICPIYDADIECDTPWIAMRLVEGKTLAQLLGEAREERESDAAAADARAEEASRHDSQDSEVTTSWPPKSTLDLHRTLLLFERSARALHAAHEAGVIHRDVKPGNLIVMPDGKPMILDFGLARDEASDLGSITESGEVFGTPAYMSPEQLAGPSEALDRRTDVYSLGIALYEALTLKRPFDKGANKAALYVAIKDEAPPDPRLANDALSLDVKVVLETAMEKDRARRYASALELAEDLRRIREYEPIRARPASVYLKLARWIRKHPALASSLIGTIAVLAVGLTVALLLNVRLQDALEVALGNHLAQRSRALTREDPSAALTLAIEAVEKSPSDLTREALVEALAASRLEALIAPSLAGRKPGRMRDLAVAPDGGRIAIAFESGAIEVHAGDGSELEHAFPGNEVAAVEVAWLPGDRGLIAAYADGRVAHLRSDRPDAVAVCELDVVPTHLELDSSGTVALVQGAPLPGAQPGTRRVRLLDVKTLTVRTRLDGLPEPIHEAWLPADGEQVVAWSRAQNVLSMRSTKDGHEIRRRVIPDLVSTLDVDGTGDSLRVAVGTRFGEVRLFDEKLVERASIVLGNSSERNAAHATSSAAMRSRESSTESVSLVRVRGEHLFASCVGQADLPGGGRGAGARAFFVQLDSGSIRELELAASSGATVAEFSPDGTELAFVDEDNRIHVVDVRSLAHERFVPGLLKPAQLEWDRTGHHLYTRVNGPFTHVWFAHGAPGVPALWPRTAEGMKRRARGAVLSPDGRLLVGRFEREGTIAWSRAEEMFRIERSLGEPLALGPGIERLASSDPSLPIVPGLGTADSTTWVGRFEPKGSAFWWIGPTAVRIDLPFGDRQGLGSANGFDLVAWSISHDGRVLAGLHENGDVLVRAEGQDEAIRFPDPGNAAAGVPLPLADELANARMIGVGLDEKGERAAICLSDGRVLVVDVRARSVLRALSDPKLKGVVATCAFRAGTHELACFGTDNRVRFWDISTGEQVREDVWLFEPRSVEYSRDGRLLLTTGRSGGGAVRVLELDPLRPVVFKTHHTSSLTAGEFSVDARFVLTAARDGTVFVRESRTGDLYARRTFEGREVLDAHFGGPVDALDIVAVTDDGAVHVWPVDPLPAAKRRFVRELDGGEIERERKLAHPLEYP